MGRAQVGDFGVVALCRLGAARDDGQSLEGEIGPVEGVGGPLLVQGAQVADARGDAQVSQVGNLGRGERSQ